MKHEFITTSQAQTEIAGQKLAGILAKDDVVVLYGELGSGKTAFARGILSGLGYSGIVSSPTFTLVNEYETAGFTVAHFDMYRVNNDETLADAGFYDYLNKSFIIMEWGDKVPWVMEDVFFKVYIEGAGNDPRKIIINRG